MISKQTHVWIDGRYSGTVNAAGVVPAMEVYEGSRGMSGLGKAKALVNMSKKKLQAEIDRLKAVQNATEAQKKRLKTAQYRLQQRTPKHTQGPKAPVPPAPDDSIPTNPTTPVQAPYPTTPAPEGTIWAYNPTTNSWYPQPLTTNGGGAPVAPPPAPFYGTPGGADDSYLYGSPSADYGTDYGAAPATNASSISAAAEDGGDAGQPAAGGSSKMLLIGAVAVAAFFMLRKKR